MRDTSLGELTTDDTPRRPTVVAERIARKDLRNALFMKLRQLSPALFAVKKPVLLKWNLRRDCRPPRARRRGASTICRADLVLLSAHAARPEGSPTCSARIVMSLPQIGGSQATG
jgi:hypothetical protein